MVLVTEKDSSTTQSTEKGASKHSSPVLPLTKRYADLVYFLFFVGHLSTALAMDLQPLYPPHLVPSFMKTWMASYLTLSRDPLVGGMVGLFGDNAHLAWFKTFVVLEGFFQTPIFIIAMYVLYYNKRTYYPLLAIYGAQSATTTLACLVHLWQTPQVTPEIIKAGLIGVTEEQRWLMLGGYTPFFIGAAAVAIDFGWRSAKLIKKAVKLEEDKKWE